MNKIMTIREQSELREKEYLSPYAALSMNSQGRASAEQECDIRPVYQRDRDRILHSKSFRRLKHKTQVFLAPLGDHYRTRLTHTLEVSQIARTIAKALRLNEDLTEAIALGHDLGHTPFGHAGETALNEVCELGFAHYEQSVRVVEKLEKHGRGLNLTVEVKDGILNHRTAGNPSTLEGKVVRLADKIAYINHDIDDAIRGHILTEEDIPAAYRNVLGHSSRERLNTLIQDIIYCSQDKPDIQQSAEIKEAMMELRAFMFRNVYQNSQAKGEDAKAIGMLQNMYHYYLEHPQRLAEEYQGAMRESEEPAERIVCDYIAGMTDHYATQKFQELFIPDAWS